LAQVALVRIPAEQGRRVPEIRSGPLDPLRPVEELRRAAMIVPGRANHDGGVLRPAGVLRVPWNAFDSPAPPALERGHGMPVVGGQVRSPTVGGECDSPPTVAILHGFGSEGSREIAVLRTVAEELGRHTGHDAGPEFGDGGGVADCGLPGRGAVHQEVLRPLATELQAVPGAARRARL